jgi:hypothetical protein
MKKYSSFYALLLLCSLLAVESMSQQIGVDTDEIESLIDEWNFANNSRNLHSFEKVYGNRVTLYGQEVSKRQAIALKQQLFGKKPGFRQRIVTEISFSPYSRGVVKCDFTREVFEETGWKKYPSYLLVSYERQRYTIIGESDYATDRALKYKPDLGEPIVFDKPADVSKSTDVSKLEIDSLLVPLEDSLPAMTETFASRDTAKVGLSAGDFPAIISDLSSMGEVTIPKGYVFLLVAILGVGGLMIFIADSIHSRKRRRVRIVPVVHRHDEAEHIVRDFKTQAGFEAFVVTLFDPLYFRHRRPKMEPVYAGNGIEIEHGPDYVFDFVQKETHVRFAIKCQYYRHIAKNEVQLLTAERQDQIRQFEEEREMDVYYVLGFGGTPDDPKELFFLPSKAVRSEYITKSTLRQYSKSGMFYFNRKTGRIQ